MAEWVVLVPSGDAVQVVRESSAVQVVTLISADQLKALAEEAATMKLAGIDVELADLLRRHATKGDEPELPFEQPIQRPARPRPPEYPCMCGVIYADPALLAAHMRQYPTHDLAYIPPEHRLP